MAARLLTPEETSAFKTRHALNFLLWSQFIPAEGRFVKNDLGWVLVFKKEDRAVLYIATDLNYDPTLLDPDKYWYIISETLKAIGENAKKTVTSVPIVLNIAVLLAIGAAIVLGLIFAAKYTPQRKS